jgi:transcriptional regulator with XRE-family HTH domain
MARAGLGWGVRELSSAASVAGSTIVDIEAGRRQAHPRTIAALRAALEAAGVEFTNGDAPGVRLITKRDGGVEPAGV